MKDDNQARISITAEELKGCSVSISRKGHEAADLPGGHSATHYLQEGDTVTITVGESDARRHARVTAGDKGQTLEEGLKAADKRTPDVDPSPGDVVVDTGATRRVTTGKAPK